MRCAVAACALLFVGCQCAEIDPNALYACDETGQCPPGKRCVENLCESAAGGDGGGAAGGHTAGGGAAGGNTAGGGRAGGGAAGGVSPGLDGIFVDPINGLANAFGDAVSPVKTLSQGVGQARTNNKAWVFVAEGTIVEPSTIDLEALSVQGGYSRTSDGGWLRDLAGAGGCGDGGRPLLLGAAIALISKPADASVTIESLCIVAADAGSGASIGLAVIGGGTRTVLRDLEILAGQGAPGLPGTDGASGDDGDAGLPGASGPVTSTAARIAGGDGGRSGCGENGGNGGDGVRRQNGQAGKSTSGAEGGMPGLGSATQDCRVNCACGTLDLGGFDGEHADAGAEGDAGAAGNPSGAVSRMTLWQPLNGATGNTGRPGGAGAGGASASAWSLVTGNLGIFESTASGGGGGAPGCGGRGGLGGGSGGASLGLLLIDASPLLQQVRVAAGNGGSGAPGGQGGPGGAGGAGAPGGPGVQIWCSGGDLSFDGGPGALLSGPAQSSGGSGGNGGRGGRGGSGGPGAGGPSIAILCSGDAGFASLGLVLIHADGGAGAAGADAGRAADAFNCSMR